MCDVKTGTCDRWKLGQTRSLIALCIYKLISVDMLVPHKERPYTSTGGSVMAVACVLLFRLQMTDSLVFALPTLRLRCYLVFGHYGEVTCVALLLQFTRAVFCNPSVSIKC